MLTKIYLLIAMLSSLSLTQNTANSSATADTVFAQTFNLPPTTSPPVAQPTSYSSSSDPLTNTLN